MKQDYGSGTCSTHSSYTSPKTEVHVFTCPNFLIKEQLVLKVKEERGRKRTYISKKTISYRPSIGMKTVIFVMSKYNRPLIRLYLSPDEWEIEKERWLAKVATSPWFNRPVESEE